jgi:glycine/D-amino acid oxidase-like deaminating enzyme
VQLTVDGLDDIPFKQNATIRVSVNIQPASPRTESLPTNRFVGSILVMLGRGAKALTLMKPQERNYWLDTIAMPLGTHGDLPDRVDVAIVGAGFTGLSAARALAKHGVAVAVLETNTVGWGASSRNGGMVLTGLKLGIESLVKRYGMELARQMYAASLASIDMVEQIVKQEQIECNFSRCGHLEVACKQSHFDTYARSVHMIAREFSHQLRILRKEDLQAEIGSEIYFGGIVDEQSAGLNPARYAAGLAAAALREGACIYEGTRVQSIESLASRGEAGFRLRTSRGLLCARDAFVATSGYTSSATPFLHKKVIPVGSFIIVTEPLPDSLAQELSPRNRMIYDSKHYLYYYRLTPDNRLLFGGRAAFFPETRSTVRKSAEILQRGMIEVYPQLRNAAVEYVWGGTLDFCFDTMPHAGRLEGMYYSLGYAGHGVALATYLGAQIAAEIMGAPSYNPYEKIRFPGAPLGLYNGRPWFLPLAGAYYKVLDWIS